jgi:Cu/Ag efflux pump CusA
MRYTKIAILVFGLGLVLGLLVIGAEIKRLERVASALMALGVTALPIGMIVDWRRAVKAAARGAKSRAAPRARKSARPKR